MVLVFLLTSLVFPGCKNQGLFKLSPKMSEIQNLETNLDGESNSRISLITERNDMDMPVNWYIIVEGIEKVKVTPEEGRYFLSEVKFDDIDGDKKAEGLLYFYSTGTAAEQNLYIYKIVNELWKEIFVLQSPDNLDYGRFKVRYMGDYKVSFYDKKYDLKATIELDKNNYIDMEDMLPNISDWVDPVASIEIKDIDNDGIKEIIANQRVIGIAHADTIGYLDTTYKLIGSCYEAVKITLSNINNELIIEKSIDNEDK